jgi:hypothetical protein
MEQLFFSWLIQQIVDYNPLDGSMVNKLARRSSKPASRSRTMMIEGKTFSRNAIAYCCAFGKWPDGHIYHVNNDPFDYRLENLTTNAPPGHGGGKPWTPEERQRRRKLRKRRIQQQAKELT